MNALATLRSVLRFRPIELHPVARRLSPAASVASSTPPRPLDLVAQVADAVGDRVEIIRDGGIYRGSDIVKALALGARACTTGRAYLLGLAAAGERGVDHVLQMIATDVRRTMSPLGAPTVADLTPDLVDEPGR